MKPQNKLKPRLTILNQREKILVLGIQLVQLLEILILLKRSYLRFSYPIFKYS